MRKVRPVRDWNIIASRFNDWNNGTIYDQHVPEGLKGNRELI